MNVIIVDNEPTILRSLEILIQPKVDSVICFADPDAALQYIKDHGNTINILIVDYFMPQMNGLQLITEALSFLKQNTVKVIMSGHIDLVPVMADKKWPIDHLLAKPFDLDCLFALIDSQRVGKSEMPAIPVTNIAIGNEHT